MAYEQLKKDGSTLGQQAAGELRWYPSSNVWHMRGRKLGRIAGNVNVSIDRKAGRVKIVPNPKGEFMVRSQKDGQYLALYSRPITKALRAKPNGPAVLPYSVHGHAIVVDMSQWVNGNAKGGK